MAGSDGSHNWSTFKDTWEVEVPTLDRTELLECNIEALLDNCDLIHDIKTGDTILQDRFATPEALRVLIRLITTEPSDDVEEACSRHRLFTAADVLVCSNQKLLAVLTHPDNDLLDQLWSFLDTVPSPTTGPVLAGYFCSTVASVFSRCPVPITEHLKRWGPERLLGNFLERLEFRAFAELLTILICVEPPSQLVFPVEFLVQRLLSHLDCKETGSRQQLAAVSEHVMFVCDVLLARSCVDTVCCSAELLQQFAERSVIRRLLEHVEGQCQIIATVATAILSLAVFHIHLLPPDSLLLVRTPEPRPASLVPVKTAWLLPPSPAPAPPPSPSHSRAPKGIDEVWDVRNGYKGGSEVSNDLLQDILQEINPAFLNGTDNHDATGSSGTNCIPQCIGGTIDETAAEESSEIEELLNEERNSLEPLLCEDLPLLEINLDSDTQDFVGKVKALPEDGVHHGFETRDGRSNLLEDNSTKSGINPVLEAHGASLVEEICLRLDCLHTALKDAHCRQKEISKREAVGRELESAAQIAQEALIKGNTEDWATELADLLKVHAERCAEVRTALVPHEWTGAGFSRLPDRARLTADFRHAKQCWRKGFETVHPSPGSVAIEVLCLLAILVRTGRAIVFQTLLRLNTLALCFEVFFSFPLNTLLHNALKMLIVEVVSNQDCGHQIILALVRHVPVMNRIVIEHRLELESQTVGGVTSRGGKRKRNHSRAGYMGHLYWFCMELKELGQRTPEIARALAETAGWDDMVLPETEARSRILAEHLGGASSAVSPSPASPLHPTDSFGEVNEFDCFKAVGSVVAGVADEVDLKVEDARDLNEDHEEIEMQEMLNRGTVRAQRRALSAGGWASEGSEA